MIRIIQCLLIVVISTTLSAQKSIPLYPEGVPHALKNAPEESHNKNEILWITDIKTPNITVYSPTPKHRNGKAVLIAPGGGYHGLAYDLEGTEIAKWLNSIGVTAFVLKYRMPGNHNGDFKSKIPLSDAIRAIKYIRKNADSLNIDQNKIGVMGFSAGGHLASTLGTHYDMEVFPKDDPYNAISARPDFMILIYPVISMEEAYTHTGSMDALLGKNPNQKLLRMYSSNKQVNNQTPPTFLLHCADDDVVPVANSTMMFESLQEHNIPSELHVFPKGGHGFGLGITHPHLKTWPVLLEGWLNQLEEK